MKTKMIFLAFCMTIMFCMSACAGTTQNTSSDLGAVTEISASENNETESPEENVMSEATAMYQLAIENKAAEDEAIGDSTMTMKIGDTKVNVDWEDNQAVEALRNMAEDGDVTIQMSMYGGFEQVGSIGQSLPRDDRQTTTSSGDIVLYNRVFENREHDHIGVVIETRENTILTAEGNIDNRSGIIERPIDGHIRAYIRIPDGFEYGTA